MGLSFDGESSENADHDAIIFNKHVQNETIMSMGTIEDLLPKQDGGSDDDGMYDYTAELHQMEKQ